MRQRDPEGADETTPVERLAASIAASVPPAVLRELRLFCESAGAAPRAAFLRALDEAARGQEEHLG